MHIAKTGGTSITEAIARLYPADCVFTDSGNITVEYLAGLGDALRGGAFISGHPGPGVARYLNDKADLITILRKPAEQAVSNYLHVLSDPENALHASARRQSFSDYLRENPGQISYQYNSLCVALALDADVIEPGRQHNVDALLRFLDTLPFVGVIERAEACCEALSRLMPFGRAIRLPHRNAAVYRGVSTRTLRQLRAEYHALRDDPSVSYLCALEALLYAKAEAVLRRVLQEAPPAGRRVLSELQGGFLPARRFSTSLGAMEGEYLVCPLFNPESHLVYGPHDRLPRGAHAAEFHLEVRDPKPPKSGRIELEVLSNGSRCLRKRWIGPKLLKSPRARTLAFINPDDLTVLEFRVRAKGFAAGSLVFGGVTLHAARLLEAWPSVVRRQFQRRRHARAVNTQAPRSNLT
jgi:hypothetical protein